MIISPKLRGKLMSHQIKSLKHMTNYSKKDIVDILLREEYGYLPPAPASVRAELTERDKKFCAGKADLEIYKLICECPFSEFSFPVRVAIPKKCRPVLAFVHINFRPDVPDKYQPTEELIDAGYAVFSFCYTEVSSDDGDFTNGLAGLIYPDGKLISATGSTTGVITTEEVGDGSFGYECVFKSDDLGITFGQATKEQKNRVSHRARALKNLCNLLENFN